MQKSKTEALPVALILILSLIGCSTFRPARFGTDQAVDTDQCLNSKSDYRFTFQDGRKMKVPGWAVRCREENYLIYEKNEWRFYPRTAVVQIEERKFSVGKTVGLTAGIVVGLAVAGLFIFAAVVGVGE